MASRLMIFFLLVSFALVHGAKLSTKENTEVVSTQREGRTLEIPLLGLFIWKFMKISWTVLSKVVNIIGWKLAAVAVVATVVINVVSWVYNNSISVALTIAMFCFCRFTGKCYPNHIPTGLIEVGENLYYAAKNLKSGIALYDNSL